MTRSHRLLFLLLTLLGLVIWRRASGHEEDEPGAAKVGIPWAQSFDAAQAEARKLGKPLLIDFEAEWCGFCKKLDRETYTDERVIRLVRERFVAVKVDVDKEPALGQKFKVEGLPTIVFLAPGGEELQRISGFKPPELFVQDIEKSGASSAALTELKELAARSPLDAAAQRAYARALLAAGNPDGALLVLTKIRDAMTGDSADKAGVYLDLGDVHRSRSDRPAARAAYEGILAMKPEVAGEARTRCLLPLANVLLGLKESQRAIEHLTEALETGKAAGRERIEALFLRGYAHAVQKDADKALADLRAVQAADKDGRWGFRATQIIELVEIK